MRNHRGAQNVFLCFASLFFYAWGEPRFVMVMLLSITVNWLLGLLVNRYRSNYGKLFVFADVLFNIGLIFIFKYLGFVIDNINSLLGLSIVNPGIKLPIGISFFTFQAISYVVDVYRQRGKAQKNLLNVALYISFFPQLIAGPIVRYETVAYEIENRTLSVKDYSDGVCRFIAGLGKKVIIANNVALVADRAFALSADPSWLGTYTPLTFAMAWLGAAAYTLQIYYDFSGYSDMAIGLGRMFGFHFLENFDYPYTSQSVTEFWRRWHISLGTWFRDYVYIPLGGSRVKGKGRHIFNLFVVWACTGIWHGANWTFIVWGLAYFVIIVFEKYTGFDRISSRRAARICKRIATMIIVIMGWVIFRSDNLSAVVRYIRQMFTIRGTENSINIFLMFAREYWIYLALGVLFSVPAAGRIMGRIHNKTAADVLQSMILIAVLVLSVSFIVKGSYNPFIYFNF